MCGEDYCETCTPDAFMVAWAQGRHHTTPKFGDGAQQWVANTKRMATLERLRSENPAAAMEFPEFIGRYYGAFVCQFAEIGRRGRNFETLVARVPAFAQHVAAQERSRVIKLKEMVKANRRERKRSNRRRRELQVLNFSLSSVGALRAMLTAVYREIPAWLLAPEARVEMALAA